MNTAALLGRKGAPRIADIPAQVLQALNAGAVPTVNLVEFLAIDLALLAPAIATQIGLHAQHERLQDTLAMLSSFKPMKRHDHIARALYDMTAGLPQRDKVANLLARHPSDLARAWAAHWVQLSGLGLAGKLKAVRRFAADTHFGVREMAWIAVRDDVITELSLALQLLQPWVHDEDANVRRFASELTRPRGVWCAQIDALKREPEHALPLLEPLKSDASRYVQNSVANWLNDASKSQPQWVSAVCQRWLNESPTLRTRYITQRALRTLRS
jgi:3-methyladenine DNA glycosylase AlkC